MDLKPLTAEAIERASERLRERCIRREEIFRGRLLTLVCDEVRLPNGRTSGREWVMHPGAACIVPEFDDGRLLVELQYRYPVGRAMVEFPAGKLDPGEHPLLCAQRELKEETGFWARSWHTLGYLNQAIAFCDEVIHIFHAQGLVAGDAALDPDELLELYAATPEQIEQMIRDNLITDTKTVTAYCRWRLAREQAR
ncbi:MAG: NUDIX hydrolase [Casimicrobiaceae bacterium]|nr:NUDIX hydrolase [Casimicrobiaceae bacterium]MCX8097493.1 NUDIX hydrolase [Casimicrobiaceae bacterium]MDW8311211.1 NUDIX hydrolase [Burkholderiales bacterium]